MSKRKNQRNHSVGWNRVRNLFIINDHLISAENCYTQMNMWRVGILENLHSWTQGAQILGEKLQTDHYKKNNVEMWLILKKIMWKETQVTKEEWQTQSGSLAKTFFLEKSSPR